MINRLEVTLEKQSPLGDWPLLFTGPQQIPEGIPMADVQQVHIHYNSIKYPLQVPVFLAIDYII